MFFWISIVLKNKDNWFSNQKIILFDTDKFINLYTNYLIDNSKMKLYW